MSAEVNVCGRFMPVSESYGGTEMHTCTVCGQTQPAKEDFLGRGCQRADGGDA